MLTKEVDKVKRACVARKMLITSKYHLFDAFKSFLACYLLPLFAVPLRIIGFDKRHRKAESCKVDYLN